MNMKRLAVPTCKYLLMSIDDVLLADELIYVIFKSF